MKIVLSQLNLTVGDVRGNQAQIAGVIEQAKVQGAHLLVFPEMVVSGYPPRDLLLEPRFVLACLAQNEWLAAQSTDTLCIVWGNLSLNPFLQGKPLLNTAFVATHGQVQTKAIKNHLPTYDVFDEARYFEPGPVDEAVAVFSWQGHRFALTVCEDLWSYPTLVSPQTEAIMPYAYPTSLFQPDLQPDFWLNVSASPFVTGKAAIRQERLRHLAQSTGAGVLYVNTVGAQDDIVFDGNSLGVFPGQTVVQAKGFAPDTVLIDTAALPTPVLWDAASPEEEHASALVLGIADYFQKTGFQKAFLGLSGGVDSALVATLAVRALGAQNVVAVAMPGPYSSNHSLTDARLLAETLGIELREVSILQPYQVYLDLLSQGQSVGDLAEQNLQARLRGVTLMTLANRENALVLATSNKSELAMGYSTLYGDSCGALAPIGDLYKTEVYALCHWFNQQAPVIPLSILTKEPSAELAPNQKDSDALPPYDDLDKALAEVFSEGGRFGNLPSFMYDDAHPQDVLRTRLERAEFKRQQSPLVLKVSARGFDSGWRAQIVKNVRLISNHP